MSIPEIFIPEHELAEATHFCIRPVLDGEYVVDWSLYDDDMTDIQIRAGFRGRPDELLANFDRDEIAEASAYFLSFDSVGRPLWYDGREATLHVRSLEDISEEALARHTGRRVPLAMQSIDPSLLETADHFELRPMSISRRGNACITDLLSKDTNYIQWWAGAPGRPAVAIQSFAASERDAALTGFFELGAFLKPLYYNGREQLCQVVDQLALIRAIEF